MVKKKSQMKDVILKARRHDIEVYEDGQLVRKILKDGKVNEYIPVDLISEVAAIFSKLSLV